MRFVYFLVFLSFHFIIAFANEELNCHLIIDEHLLKTQLLEENKTAPRISEAFHQEMMVSPIPKKQQFTNEVLKKIWLSPYTSPEKQQELMRDHYIQLLTMGLIYNKKASFFPSKTKHLHREELIKKWHAPCFCIEEKIKLIDDHKECFLMLGIIMNDVTLFNFAIQNKNNQKELCSLFHHVYHYERLKKMGILIIKTNSPHKKNYYTLDHIPLPIQKFSN